MIEVRTSPIHDRGAFARTAIPMGERFHVAQLLVLGCAEHAAIQATTVASYVFYIEDCPDDPNREVTGLVMSEMSFANHSANSNTAFSVNGKERTVTFIAVRDIAAGEEITIDYGDYAEKLGIS